MPQEIAPWRQENPLHTPNGGFQAGGNLETQPSTVNGPGPTAGVVRPMMAQDFELALIRRYKRAASDCREYAGTAPYGEKRNSALALARRLESAADEMEASTTVSLGRAHKR